MANLKEAWDYAAKNPNSEFARNLKSMASSGALNVEAKKYGIDLSEFQKSKEQGVLQTLSQTIAKPILTAGATLGSGLEMAGAASKMIAGKVSGNQNLYKSGQESAQEAYQKYNTGVDFGYLGTAKPVGGIGASGDVEDVGRYVGDIVSTGANLGLLVASPLKGGRLPLKVGVGAGTGYISDVATNVGQDGVQVSDFIPGLGTAIGGAFPIAGAGLSAVKQSLPKASQSLNNLMAKIVKPTSIDDTIGQVVQGKTKDIQKAQTTFKNLDVTKVKTYKDLADTIDEGISAYAKKVDDALTKDPTEYSLQDLIIKKTSTGGKEVPIDYVSRGLDQLSELYTKTGDDLARADIDEVRLFLQNGGRVTKKQVNDIARLYNEELGAKGFSKIGEPLTSANAQSYEITRKGLKEVARQGMDEEAANLDKIMSAMYNTKRLVESNVEQVNKLKQRIQERGLGEKIGRAAAKVINTIGIGSPKGFFEAMTKRGEGQKILNFLDLEKNLEKNLKFIKKALDSNDDNVIANTTNTVFGKATNAATNTATNSASKAKPPTGTYAMGAAVIPEEQSKEFEDKFGFDPRLLAGVGAVSIFKGKGRASTLSARVNKATIDEMDTAADVLMKAATKNKKLTASEAKLVTNLEEMLQNKGIDTTKMGYKKLANAFQEFASMAERYLKK